MNEIWKPVVEFEGLYEVSDFGRVRSLERTCKTGRGDGTRRVPACILTPSPHNKYGHRNVGLCRDGKSVTRQVHQLVLEAHEGPCPPGMECRHLDGDPTNNQLDNLRWDTHIVNMSDRNAHGTAPRGERHGRAKLQNSDIGRIRLLADVGIMKMRIAEMFGVSHVNIGFIIRRETWRHVASA